MLTSLLLLCLFAPQTSRPASPPTIELGIWEAKLHCPGGAIQFNLEFAHVEGQLTAAIYIGEERIPIPELMVYGSEVVLDFVHYQSQFQATLGADGQSLEGTWSKVGAGGSTTTMPLVATWGADPMPGFASGGDSKVDGRWSVRFSSSKTPAVGVFSSRTGDARGTFLTSLGDYRFLAGSFRNNHLELSCFDGAHAFLFKAVLRDGKLSGDFWSRDSWHETWTAELDPEAALPDPFGLSTWNEGVSIDLLEFLDPKAGVKRSLGAKEFNGKLRLIQLFGTWCPNCHDEAPFLAELWDAYHERGLQIVGLAFEHTGNQVRDSTQLERFRKRYEIPYPLLLAGVSDKSEATKAFRGLERVIAYPTVLFVDEQSRVRYIHTGFSGPATGKFHEREKERFHELIRELLAEAK